jgi:hypothetical protein
VYRIVFEQMSERRRIGDIVDRDDLKFRLTQRCPKEHPTDPAEAVYSNLARHVICLRKTQRKVLPGTLDKEGHSLQVCYQFHLGLVLSTQARVASGHWF